MIKINKAVFTNAEVITIGAHTTNLFTLTLMNGSRNGTIVGIYVLNTGSWAVISISANENGSSILLHNLSDSSITIPPLTINVTVAAIEGI